MSDLRGTTAKLLNKTKKRRFLLEEMEWKCVVLMVPTHTITSWKFASHLNVFMYFCGKHNHQINTFFAAKQNTNQQFMENDGKCSEFS